MRFSLLAIVLLAGATTLAQPQGAPQQPPTGGAGAAAPAAGRGATRVPNDPIDFDDHPGWTQMFDGQSLKGWDGNTDVWKVVDGAIVGEFTGPVGQRNQQTFLIWSGEPADYELKLEIKVEGITADSGIQYRAYRTQGQGRAAGAGGGAAAPAAPAAGGAAPAGGAAAAPAAPNPWNLGGYQFDFNFPGNYNGQLAEAGTGARGIIAYRGQVVRAEEGKRPRIISTVGTLEELGGYFKQGDWNQVHLIANRNVLTHSINGHVMAILIDEDATKLKTKGLIGLQCAGSGAVKISFRNLWLRTL